MLVMQHELIGYVERLMQGIHFDDEALGLEVIEQVGPGGTFMDQEHTAAHFRQELWFPKLLDRQFYDAWLSAGAKTMAQRCREEKEHLLKEHRPEPLPEEVDREIERILSSARSELEDRGSSWHASE
jgi:trimethylamine--corrinoid protein Co-methyltransferase